MKKILLVFAVAAVLSGCVTEWRAVDYQPMDAEDWQDAEQDFTETVGLFNGNMKLYRSYYNVLINEYNTNVCINYWWGFGELVMIITGSTISGAFALAESDGAMLSLPLGIAALSSSTSSSIREALFKTALELQTERLVDVQIKYLSFIERYGLILREYNQNYLKSNTADNTKVELKNDRDASRLSDDELREIDDRIRLQEITAEVLLEHERELLIQLKALTQDVHDSLNLAN